MPLARAAHIGGASTPDRALALARIITANAMLLEKWEGAAAAGLYRAPHRTRADHSRVRASGSREK